MFDFIYAVIAIGIGGQNAPSDGIAAPLVPQRPQTAQTPATPGKPDRPDAPAAPSKPALPAAFDMSVVPPGLAAEDQTPSGRFTTAAEVKPILDATRGSWVAVRDYNGQDYVYVTHLWSWRCGLAAIAISVNDQAMQSWPMPPCHVDTSAPNAILESDPLPYMTFAPGSVQSVQVQLVYDDLSLDSARFTRGEVLIP